MGHSNELKPKNKSGQWKPGQALTEEDYELLKPIVEVARILGHTPRVQDVPNADKIKNRFRIWKNALLAAGFPLYSAPEQEVLRRIAADLRQTNEADAEDGDLNQIDHDEIVRMALDCGFYGAAIISMDDVVTDSVIRSYCEKNRCGRFNTNYSCPPVCGTPEAMEKKLRFYHHALVLQTKWYADDYNSRRIHPLAAKSHDRS